MVLAEKSPAQTAPEPWLLGDRTSWGSTVSQLDLRRIRQAPKGKTTVHSSSLSATHKPRYGSVGPSQCIHVSQHNTKRQCPKPLRHPAVLRVAVSVERADII